MPPQNVKAAASTTAPSAWTPEAGRKPTKFRRFRSCTQARKNCAYPELRYEQGSTLQKPLPDDQTDTVSQGLQKAPGLLLHLHIARPHSGRNFKSTRFGLTGLLPKRGGISKAHEPNNSAAQSKLHLEKVCLRRACRKPLDQARLLLQQGRAAELLGERLDGASLAKDLAKPYHFPRLHDPQTPLIEIS